MIFTSCADLEHTDMWRLSEYPSWDIKNFEYKVILKSARTGSMNLFKFDQLWLWMKDLEDNS